MKKSILLEAVKSAFDDINTDSFTMETNFKDNDEWSSLTALALITILDSEFSLQLSGDELSKIQTIQELYDKIRK